MGRTTGVILGSAACCAWLLAVPAEADNAAFQDFFLDVCTNPTGALAARCGETTAAAGDLSGDSESSLNPSQTLSSTDGAVAAARARSQEARERVERYLRHGEERESDLTLGPLNVLLNGRFEWEERDREVDADAERGFEADRRAIEIGFDGYFTDRLVLGLLYAYEDGELEFDAELPGRNFTPAGDAGSIDREAHSVTLYGMGWITERAWLEANVGYAASNYTVTRNSVFQESTRTVAQTDVRVRAGTDGDQAWAGLAAGYDWNAGATSLGAYAGATYARSRLDGYREQDPGNSGLALVVDDIDRDALTGHVGVRAQRAIGTSFGVLVPQMRVEYEHTGGVDDSEATVRFALDGGGNRFELNGDGFDDYVSVAASVAAVFPNGWISFADVEGLVAAGDRERFRFTIGVRKEL